MDGECWLEATHSDWGFDVSLSVYLNKIAAICLPYMCGLLNCSQVRGVNAEVNTQRCEYTNRGVNTERGSSTQDVEENQQTQLLENFFA